MSETTKPVASATTTSGRPGPKPGTRPAPRVNPPAKVQPTQKVNIDAEVKKSTDTDAAVSARFAVANVKSEPIYKGDEIYWLKGFELAIQVQNLNHASKLKDGVPFADEFLRITKKYFGKT